MRFADITGQHELKRHLAASVDAGRISHAQLFTGIAGAGTLPLAIAYAQYIHCRNRRRRRFVRRMPVVPSDCRAGTPRPPLRVPREQAGQKKRRGGVEQRFHAAVARDVRTHGRLLLAAGVVRRAESGQDAQRRDFDQGGGGDNPQTVVQEFRVGIQDDDYLAARNDERRSLEPHIENP